MLRMICLRRWAALSAWMLAGLLAEAPASAQPAHELCRACHTEVAQDFLEHPHSNAGMSCDTCHGESKQHRESAGGAEPDRIAGPLQILDLCGPCHDRPPAAEAPAAAKAGVLAEYKTSKHGIRFAEPSKVRAPHCGTCHDVHGLRSAKAMLFRCQRCHSRLPEACSGEPAQPAASDLRCAGCHQPHVFAAPNEPGN